MEILNIYAEKYGLILIMQGYNIKNTDTKKWESKKQQIGERTAYLYADLFNRHTDKEFLQKSQEYLNRIKINKDWFAGKTCLDAGCGSGIASYGLAAINQTKVIAFDFGWECLNIAQKRLRDPNNFSPIQASIEAIPFKDSSFDFVNCNGVLHHLLDPDTALSEISRVLKPGGFFFMGVYGRGGLMNEYKIGFYRLLAKFVPYLLLRKLLWVKKKNELLDNICVPIRNPFSENEIRNKLSFSGFSEITRIAEDFYRTPNNLWQKIIIGPDGMYLHFLAKKRGFNEE